VFGSLVGQYPEIGGALSCQRMLAFLLSIKLRLLHAVDASFGTIHQLNSHYVVGPEIMRPLVNIYASSVMIMALMIQIVFVHYESLIVNA